MRRISSTLAVGGMLALGTVASLLAKIIYGVESVGRDGRVRPFRKPLFEVFSMFLGMALCVVLDWWTRDAALELEWRQYQEAAAAAEAVDGSVRSPTTERGSSTWRIKAWFAKSSPPSTSPRIIILPALLDLAATALMCTGLLFAPVSVYQMLRGSMLVFCAVFSVTLLHRRLHYYNYLGVSMALAGISLVGLASILSEPDATAQAELALGMVLMVAGQAAQALQVVAEEHLLQNLRLPAMRVVSYEGLYGMALCVLVLFPLAYLLPGYDLGGRWEDEVDSVVMIAHSGALAAILVVDAGSMLFFNLFSLNVTQLSSAMFRTILETMRTLLVWVVDLWLYYGWTGGRFGEAWTRYSWLQVAGFVAIVAGTFTYGKQPVDIGPVAEEVAAVKEEEEAEAERDTEAKLAPPNYGAVAPRAAAAAAAPPPQTPEPIDEEAAPAYENARPVMPVTATPHSYGTSPAFFMRHGGISPAVYVGSPLPFGGSMRLAEPRNRLRRRRSSHLSVDSSHSGSNDHATERRRLDSAEPQPE
ncbi:hypothetical protein CDCA_CDCA05G1537 [Cyanidium caldarium]|uniref:EamA domain-containing protein n=1 Tax=Cyanidium caldarium TaxID=2771 RepID=A0AAV9IT63_CYACA|nr:hypothetical protein CDCA_CDCA05G1537 [Cyanidium caldarium]